MSCCDVSRIVGGTAKCAAQAPNHFWNGKGFVVTWKFGCRDFEQHEAREYCQSMGECHSLSTLGPITTPIFE